MLCLTEIVEHSIYDLWGRNIESNPGDLKLLSDCLSITAKWISD